MLATSLHLPILKFTLPERKVIPMRSVLAVLQVPLHLHLLPLLVWPLQSHQLVANQASRLIRRLPMTLQCNDPDLPLRRRGTVLQVLSKPLFPRTVALERYIPLGRYMRHLLPLLLLCLKVGLLTWTPIPASITTSICRLSLLNGNFRKVLRLLI